LDNRFHHRGTADYGKKNKKPDCTRGLTRDEAVREIFKNALAQRLGI
jgi:hypothetical protein